MHQNQMRQLTSSSLDYHTGSPHMLSSSLSTSGIGLSGDLEDLDYKGNSTAILQSMHHNDDLIQHQLQHNDELEQQFCEQNATGASIDQASNATTSSKAKLNTPRRNAWGNMSYADLISQAINSTNDKRLTLAQIYDWMVQHVPYFKDKGDSNSSAGWKNSVRHNLSLHNRFKRLQNEGTGKSSWWTINPEATVAKCARRRAASMEASKFEKKRGRAKKKADAIRHGLLAFPALTNSSLNSSIGQIDTQQDLASSSQFCSQKQVITQQQQQQLARAQSQSQQQRQQQHDSQQQQQVPLQSGQQSSQDQQQQIQSQSAEPDFALVKQEDSAQYTGQTSQDQHLSVYCSAVRATDNICF